MKEVVNHKSWIQITIPLIYICSKLFHRQTDTSQISSHKSQYLLFLVGNPKRIANSKSGFVCWCVCYRKSLNLYYTINLYVTTVHMYIHVRRQGLPTIHGFRDFFYFLICWVKQFPPLIKCQNNDWYSIVDKTLQ